MNNSLIVTLDAGEPVVSSLILAEGLGIAHRALIASVRKHLKSVEEFGRVLFRKAPQKTAGGTQLITLVDLNENQALFVGSMSENTPQVVSFKVTLIREFEKARKAVALHIPNTGLIQLINAQTEKLILLERKIDSMKRDHVKAFRARVVSRNHREYQKSVEVKKSERDTLFSLFERYVKLHSFESGSAILDTILKQMVSAYNVDLRIQTRKTGEHYFDVAIRFGLGHCVAEVIKCHLFKSGDLK